MILLSNILTVFVCGVCILCLCVLRSVILLWNRIDVFIATTEEGKFGDLMHEKSKLFVAR